MMEIRNFLFQIVRNILSLTIYYQTLEFFEKKKLFSDFENDENKKFSVSNGRIVCI